MQNVDPRFACAGQSTDCPDSRGLRITYTQHEQFIRDTGFMNNSLARLGMRFTGTFREMTVLIYAHLIIRVFFC